MTSFALHLLRHGAPVEVGPLFGWTDAAPSDGGIVHCLRSTEGLSVGRLITSDLARARQAGEALSGRCGLPLNVDSRWRELDFGRWESMRPDEIDKSAYERFFADPDRNPPPGGERWRALQDRVATALQALDPVPTLVVAHGGTMRAALSVLCRLDHQACWAFHLPYAALLTLRVWPGDSPSAQIVALSA